MNAAKIATAKAEARRFLEAVKVLEAEIVRQEAENKARQYSYVSTPKQSGSVRRASMDLTRALANMRTHD